MNVSSISSGLEEIIEVEDVLSSLQRVLSGEHSAPSEVSLRDPNTFIAGELHNHVDAWSFILQDYQDKEPNSGIYFSGCQYSGLSTSFQGGV